MNYIPTTHKFVAVINKKIPLGNALNALAHASAGLVGGYPNPSDMRFADYIDQDGGKHKSISDNPFIVLQADNSNKLRTLRTALSEAKLCFTDFTSTMTVGTYADQHERTAKTPELELEYFCVVMFGPIDKIEPLTKKFSLWRS